MTNELDEFGAYFFGNLKPRKPSENGRLRKKNASYQKSAHSKNGSVCRIRSQKSQKNENSDKIEFERIAWLNQRSYCNALYFCNEDPKRKELTKLHFIFECFVNSSVTKRGSF